jgi:hypothetical protein
MSTKPALGWLALVLFATTSRAEGSRPLVRDAGAVIAPVTPKTKAGPGAVEAAARASRPSPLLVLESAKPQVDYEAETYSAVPLDGDLAKGKGLAKGLVFMVFDHERRAAFRLGKERVRRVVRLTSEDGVEVASLTKAGALRHPRERWDVLDTEDGVVVVATTTTSSGLFTTSDVYAFPRGATLERRLAQIDALPIQARGRIRDVLTASERKR